MQLFRDFDHPLFIHTHDLQSMLERLLGNVLDQGDHFLGDFPDLLLGMLVIPQILEVGETPQVEEYVCLNFGIVGLKITGRLLGPFPSQHRGKIRET